MSQPQPPPLDEQGEAHEALNSAVASYGPRILENPQVLRNVVTDLLPDQSREQNLLIAAAEAGVAADLNQHVRDQNLDSSTAVQLAAHALAGKKSIDADSSMWVTTEYARAMGYTVPAYVPQSVPASAPPSPSNATPPAQPVPPGPVPPQSVPPYAQSVPPQPPPPYAQQSVPPSGAWGGGGAPVTPWTSGQTPPGGPMMPPGGGKGKNRGILIAAAAAAAVLVIWMVTAASAHVFPFHPAPSPTPTHPPVVQSSPPPPSPSPSSSPSGPSNTDVANQIADLVVGNGSLTALSGPDGTATRASCNPDTVSNPPDVNTPTTASCDIVYSDGTTWRQTVTVDFDNTGSPISDSTNPGTQIG